MSIKILMFGYNGANNTGAEALLLQDIHDVRMVFGDKVVITIPTLNESNLRRYVQESESLRIVPMPTLYFAVIRRLVREHDLVMLVEGSTYMDTWGSPLLWAFLWATHCASRFDKRCLAYAVDAGSLSAANQRRVSRIASLTDLIITRSKAAAERLRAIGVKAPIEITADNAFLFDPGYNVQGGPEERCGEVGLAVVDFTLWPVVMRLWGRREDCYRWPYYFSCSRKRTTDRERLASGWAGLADELIKRQGKRVVLVCMEQVDEPLARMILARIRHPQSVRIITARKQDASAMTRQLRSFELLVTSRFHASVLSLAAGVPQIAVGHDVRLATLYHDLGLGGKWLLNPQTMGLDHLFISLGERVRTLIADPGKQQETLLRGYEEHVRRAQRNRILLANFALTHFPDTVKETWSDEERRISWIA